MAENKNEDPFCLLPLPDWSQSEHWEMVNLPEHIKSLRKFSRDPTEKSKTLNKAVAQQHDNYENNISEMSYQMSVINVEIEERIREQSSDLKAELNFLQETRNANIEKLNAFQIQLLTFDNSQFAECKTFCANVLDDGINSINNFYTFLKDQEKLRSEKYKKILHNGYQILIKSTCKLPQETQFYFEDQILKINQNILTNLRNYQELKSNLMTVYINDIKLSLYKITEMESDWARICKQHIIHRLEEFHVNKNAIQELLCKNQEIKDIIKLYNEKLEGLLQTIELVYSPPHSDTSLWFQKAKETMNDLDDSTKKLIVLFQTTAEKIFINYFSESVELVKNRSLISKMDLEIMIKNIIMPPESTIEEMIENLTADMKILWDKALCGLLEILRDRFLFIQELDSIFIKHNLRMKELRETTTNFFNKMSREHDKYLKEKEEIQLNIMIDSIRQEFVFNKLKQGLDNVYKTLDKIKAIMEKSREEELDCVRKFQDFSQKESDLHIMELKYFIEKHATDIQPNKSLMPLNCTDTHILFKELKVCLCEVSELNIWKNEILEEINDIFHSVVRDSLKIVCTWVNGYENQINEKYDKLFAFHNLRYDRIKSQIADVRLAEINKHEQIFNLHKQAVEKTLTKLADNFIIFEKDQQTKLDEFVKSITEGSVKYRELTDYFILQTKLEDVYQLIKKKKNELSAICEENATKISAEVNNLFATTCSYVEEIKLFSEGGNFSSAEAKAFTKRVKTLDTFIGKRSRPLFSKVEGVFSKFETQFDVAFDNIDNSLADTNAILMFKNVSDNYLRQIQNEIKYAIFQLKLKKKVIDTMFEKLTRCSKKDSNNFSNTNYVVKGITDLLRLSRDFRDYLDEGNSPAKIKSTTKSVTVLTTGAAARKASMKPQSLSKTHKSIPTSDEAYLFESSPSNEDKFLPIISLKLNNMFTTIKKQAKELYQSVRTEELEFSGILPLSFPKFMLQLAQKFVYYYYQCAEVWCLQVFDLTTDVKKFLNFVTDYCEKYLQFVQNSQKTLLQKGLKEFLDNVNAVKEYHWNNVRSIHYKLKPLHGYPGNKKLLLNLNEEMTAALKTAYKCFSESIEPLKMLKENYANEYFNVISEVRIFIEKMNEVTSESNICDKLDYQVQELTSTNNNSTFDIDMKKYGKMASKLSLSDKSGTDLSVFVETLDGNFSQEFTGKLQKLEEDINTLKEEFEKQIETEINIWNEDLSKVSALYTLKYL